MGFKILMVVMVVMATGVNATPLDTLQPVSYSGWKVLEVQLGAAAERVTNTGRPSIDLTEFDDAATVHVLTQNRRTGRVEVAVSPSALPSITEHLDKQGALYTTLINDLGRKIKETEPILRAEENLRGGVTFSRYMTYDEITTYVEGLQKAHPGQVRVEVAGRSVEGRPIHLITITDNVADVYTSRKPVVFIDGGIHAREWVSPAAVVGVVDNLLKTPRLTAGIEWRVMPLVNPDGYVTTWNKDRLWRKNTAKGSSNRCLGVDLNRNFGYHWGEAGSSGRECSTIYRGPYAFSEPEAKAVRDAVLKESARTKAYITFHSYGQMILYPWGYTAKTDIENKRKLASVGNAMAKAIRKTNRKNYTVGSAAGVLYPAAGGSDDWAAGVANIPLSYTIELRDKGSGGFLLPGSQIQPTVTDAWLAMKTLGEEILGGDQTHPPEARPAAYPPRQASEGLQDVEFQEPAEGDSEALQVAQTPGKRKEGQTNTNQELVHIIPPAGGAEGEVVNRNEGESLNQGPGSSNQGQDSISQAEESLDHEVVNRNEGESLNQGPGSLNQAGEGLDKEVVRNEGESLTQGPGSLNQGPGSINQADESLDLEPINRNDENTHQRPETTITATDNKNSLDRNPSHSPSIRDEGTDVRNQRPITRDPGQGDSTQDSIETFDSNDSSFETVSSASGSGFRAASEPHFNPLRSYEFQIGRQDALGRSVLRAILQGSAEDSSEGSESEE